jgi:glycosyltransferase involved in cell wall biosynthesis
MSVLEAMAAGVPVIASNIGGIGDVIDDGVEGFLIVPGDVEALADRMLRIAGDDALVERMGRSARLRALRQFGIDRSAEAIWQIYRKVLGLT